MDAQSSSKSYESDMEATTTQRGITLSRWGLDHHNAMDVGLNPDSREGQALVEYLRANGIPFTAFHFAIPRIATGPTSTSGFRRTGLQRPWPASESVKKEGLCREK